MEALGERVEVFALLPTRDPRFHGDIARLQGSVRYVPDVTDLRMLLRYNGMARRRFGRRYRTVLLGCLATFRPMLAWRFLQAAFVAERAAQAKITHLHAHFASRPASVARLAAALMQVPYSFTAHAVDIFKEPVDRRVLSRKIADAAFVVTVSDSNKAYLDGIADGSAHKVHRIYNGIDLARFAPRERPRGEGPLSVLCVARLVEKKGIDVLIEACGLLHRSGLDFRCRIVGQGRLRPRLQARIVALGLRDKVRLLSAHTQAEIVERYAEADLFALPCIVGRDGNRDGLPVSIVEALACGVPVVATPVSGIPEAVRDGENGLLVPENDPEALAAAIRRLAEDGALRARLAAAARGWVLDRFDQRTAAASLARLIAGAEA
jgi:glycosyltransferase involved in cell wall biosynthesis